MISAMRPVIIAGNWKMNTLPAEAGALARALADATEVEGVTRVVCPPFVSLAVVRDALTGRDVAVGACAATKRGLCRPIFRDSSTPT